jgi:NAD(P)-dependent dehydrogenase (short-subunit alcohol dehydrogenase family)
MNLRAATVMLTGATGGIGRATALLLAGRVRTLLLHGPHTPGQAEALLADVRASAGPATTVRYLWAVYGSLAEVRTLADAAGQVDLLINNAGIPGPAWWTASRDGNELTLQTNYLAATVLTGLLLAATPPN